MTTSLEFESPVHLKAVAAENLPAVTPALEGLYPVGRGRVARGAETAPVREAGSSVYTVFDGSPVFEALKLNRTLTEGDTK
jgi:hypothetical protein